MTIRLGRVTAFAILALAGAGSAASAQTAKPTPTPAPTPIGFSAQAHANVTVVAQSNTFTGSAQFIVAQRAELMRIDLLSVKSDSFPVPPLNLTAVIDRRANTLTLWNDATKQYRVQPFIPRAAASAKPRPSTSPQVSPTPRPSAPRTSPFSKLEVLEASLRLTGHTTTAGLPTTGFAFDLQVKNTGDAATSRITATTQLADDFVAFPMTIDIAIEPGMVPFSAKMAYAVDDVSRSAPAMTRFRIPAGYTEAPSLLNVVFPQRRPK